MRLAEEKRKRDQMMRPGVTMRNMRMMSQWLIKCGEDADEVDVEDENDDVDEIVKDERDALDENHGAMKSSGDKSTLTLQLVSWCIAILLSVYHLVRHRPPGHESVTLGSVAD